MARKASPISMKQSSIPSAVCRGLVLNNVILNSPSFMESETGSFIDEVTLDTKVDGRCLCRS